MARENHSGAYLVAMTPEDQPPATPEEAGGQEIGLVNAAYVLLLGMSVASAVWLFLLAEWSNLRHGDIGPIASQLASIGTVLHAANAGMWTLIAVALAAIYRPDDGPLRNVLRATSIVVMIASVAALVLDYQDGFNFFYTDGDFSQSVLVGPGTSAVQAGFALALLDRFPNTDRKASLAIIGFMATAIMTLALGLFQEADPGLEVNDPLRQAQLLSGSLRSSFSLVAAGALVALSGQEPKLARYVLRLAGLTVVMAAGAVALGLSSDAGVVGLSHAFGAPGAIIVTAVAAASAMLGSRERLQE